MRDLGLVKLDEPFTQPADPGHGAQRDLLPASRVRAHRVFQSGRRAGGDRREGPARRRGARGGRPAGGVRRHRHDVEVEEQRRGPATSWCRSSAPTRRGSSSCSPRRRSSRSSGRTRACRAPSASCAGSGAPCTSTPRAVPPARSTSATLDERQKALRHELHQTIAKVTDDVGRRYTFNTAIAAVMELLNELGPLRGSRRAPPDRAVVAGGAGERGALLSPMVPHICHRLWQVAGARPRGRGRALAGR